MRHLLSEEDVNGVRSLALPAWQSTCAAAAHALSTQTSEESADGLIAQLTATGVKARPARAAVRVALLAMCQAMTMQWTSAMLQAELAEAGIPREHAAACGAVWMSAGKAAVLHEAALPLPSTGMLVDVKWQFGVTVSTNDVARAGATYVDMKFVTDEGGKLVTHSVELSLTQFYRILGQLESAKSYVDLMSPDTASAAK